MVYHCFLNNKFLFITVLLLFLSKPLWAQEPNILQKNGVTLVFIEQLRPAAEEAFYLYPIIRSDLEAVFGWKVNFTPTVLLIPDNFTFQRMAGNDLIVAYAVPERNLMVINFSKMKTDPFTLEGTMKHELCHLLLHQNIRRENLPRWLDEGIAQWVSDGLADILMNRYSPMDNAIISNRYITLDSLRKTFPNDGWLLTLAYAESKSIVDYIIRVYGPEGIFKLLGYLKDGYEFNRAVMKSYTISFDELERRWYNSLDKRAALFTFLASNLYEILFFLAALLLIYGFIRVLIKRKAYEDYEEEDEDFLM
jgi:hypothetical protein